MGKRLLNQDYKDIVFEALKMSEYDFYNYYLNIVEDNYKYNKDIIERLRLAVDNKISWYKSKVYGGTVKVQMKDGTIEYLDRNQTFFSDKSGNRIKENLEETFISLLPEFNIIGQVNRAFFDRQLKILDTIQGSIDLKNSILEF